MNLNEGLFDIFDTKKREITNLLNKLNIVGLFRINSDYSVDVDTHVSITNKTLEECPIVFRNINGNFIWHYGNLKNLKNFPKRVKGNLVVANNKIETLLECTTEFVGGDFNCSNNKIKNFVGIPEEIKGSIYCVSCGLESLDGLRGGINKDLIINNNNLKNLNSKIRSVNGTLDCRNNKIESLINMPPCRDLILDDNPLSVTDNQLHIKFPDFEVDDEILYKKDGSKYDGLKGKISAIEETSSEDPEIKYSIKFDLIDNPNNPNLLKNTTILHIEKKYIQKLNDKKETGNRTIFSIGDEVTYKYTNITYYGKIINILNDLIKVKFQKTGEYWIHNDNLRLKKDKTVKKEEEEKEAPVKKEEKISVKKDLKINDRIVFLDPGGKLDGREGEITSIFYNKNNEPEYIVRFWFDGRYHFERNVPSKKLEKIKTTDFISGEKVIYIGPYAYYSYKEGKIKHIFGDYVDLIMNDGYLLASIPKTYIKKSDGTIPIKTTKKDDKTKEFEFKIGDPIVYVKSGDDFDNSKGVISYVNTYNPQNGEYDITVTNRKGIQKRINFVDSKNIKPHVEKYEKGDKVIYDNVEDKYFHNKIGAIKYISEDNIVKLVFRTEDDKIKTISNVKIKSLTRYEPIIDIFINDDIIYTKIDSAYYGCLGTVIAYSISTDKYEIQIISKENKKVKIKDVKLINIDKQPPKRDFKKGDEIRYMNPNNTYNGSVGTIINKISKEKYEITLKLKNGGTAYLTTFPEFLVSLKDSNETPELKIGQEIIYKKIDSKYNNRKGEFRGKRTTDGKFEIELKNPFQRLWVDGEYVYAIGEEPKPVTTSWENGRKKKKKEKYESKPPVLVYNRRNVARKAGRKPMPQADETITEQ